jgi:hypothetical protein
MRHLVIVGFVAASLIACSAAAPTGPQKDPDDTETGEQDSTGKPKSGSSSGGSSSGGSSSGGSSSGGSSSGGSSSGQTGDSGGAACASADVEACFTCCEKANPQGAAKANAAFDADTKCTCAADACGSSCKNSFFCDGEADPSAACSQCMDTNAKVEACGQALETAMNDSEVVKYMKCIDDAKCGDDEK